MVNLSSWRRETLYTKQMHCSFFIDMAYLLYSHQAIDCVCSTYSVMYDPTVLAQVIGLIEPSMISLSVCVCVSVNIDLRANNSGTVYPHNLKFCSLIVKAIV